MTGPLEEGSRRVHVAANMGAKRESFCAAALLLLVALMLRVPVLEWKQNPEVRKVAGRLSSDGCCGSLQTHWTNMVPTLRSW